METLKSLRSTAETRVDEYTDPAKTYSFRTYDVAPLNTGDTLRAEDILAANLLSLRLGWQQVVPLFAKGEGAAQSLLTRLNDALVSSRRAASFEDIPSEEELDGAFVAIAAANRASVVVKGWTPVTVSKVLHRHAPHFIPIVDSRVRAFYDVRPGDEAELRRRLWRDITSNIDWIRPLAERYQTTDGRALTVLRLVDMIIWTSLPSETDHIERAVHGDVAVDGPYLDQTR